MAPGDQILNRLLRYLILIAKSLLILLLVFYVYQLYLESGPPMVLGICAIIAWQIFPSGFTRVTVAIGRLARRRMAAAVLIGCLSFGISAAITLKGPVPQPRVHDEFSYLLAADTFARGRLANPPHPLWIHFESFYIIHQPSYSSQYPPGQGLILALGQVVSGYPIVGAWIGVGFACAATCWMLMGWLPPRWALLGGVLSALHPLVLAWGQNYWGGAIAMSGGALVLGSFHRLWQKAHVRHAIVLGIGMGVLAASRPYEGAVLSAVVMLLLAGRIVRGPSRVLLTYIRRVGLPLATVLALVAAALAFYNLKVTGSVLRMPVSVAGATHGIAPPLLWQSPYPEPSYNHQEIRSLYVDWSLPQYEAQRSSLDGLLSATIAKGTAYSDRYFQGWIVVLLPLLACGLVRNRRLRLMSIILFVFTITILAETWNQPHYAAPGAALFLGVLLQSCRNLSTCRFRAIAIGRPFARGLLILFAATLVTADLKFIRTEAKGWPYKRAQILEQLQLSQGKHLVMVRYGPGHSPHDEWVYNEADIDGAKVIWAREMNPEQNSKLLDYFKERVVWLLEPDNADPVLMPYAQVSHLDPS